MADATSFLSPPEIAEVQQAQRDAFATALGLGTPAVTVTIETMDDATGLPVTSAPKEVVMRFDHAASVPQTGGEGGGEAPVTGRMKAWAPWTDATNGARFALADGRSGTITFVEPVRNGVIRARFTLDTGR